ncbi:hypothetical protein ABPG72_018619 [Tetrahymena utriculariae]
MNFELLRFDPNQKDEQILTFYQGIFQNSCKNLKILRQKPNFEYREDLTFLYHGNQTQLDLQKIKKELLYDFSTMCDSSCQIRSLQDLKYVQCRSKLRSNLLARVVKNNYEKRFVIIHFYLEKSEKKQFNCLQTASKDSKEDKLLVNQHNYQLLEKERLKELQNILCKTILDNNQKASAQVQEQENLQKQCKARVDSNQKTTIQTLDLLSENIQQNKCQNDNYDEQARRSERIKFQKNISDQNYEFDEDDAYNKNKFLTFDQNTATLGSNFENEMSSDTSTSDFEVNSDFNEDFNTTSSRPKNHNNKKNQNSKSSSDEHQQNAKVQKTNQELSQFGNKQFIDQQQPQFNNPINFEKQSFLAPPPLFTQPVGVRQTKDNKKIIINQKRNMQNMVNSNQNNELQQQKDTNKQMLQEENTVKKMKIEDSTNNQTAQNKIQIEQNVYQSDQNLNTKNVLGQLNNHKVQEKQTDNYLYDSIFNLFKKFYQEESSLQNLKNQQVDDEVIQQKQKILNSIKNKLKEILVELKQYNN